MQLIEADLNVGVYDEFREVMVIPRGLCGEHKAELVLELMRERRFDGVDRTPSVGLVAG